MPERRLRPLGVAMVEMVLVEPRPPGHSRLGNALRCTTRASTTSAAPAAASPVKRTFSAAPTPGRPSRCSSYHLNAAASSTLAFAADRQRSLQRLRRPRAMCPRTSDQDSPGSSPERARAARSSASAAHAASTPSSVPASRLAINSAASSALPAGSSFSASSRSLAATLVTRKTVPPPMWLDKHVDARVTTNCIRCHERCIVSVAHAAQ